MVFPAARDKILTWATGMHGSNHQTGFSLLELLLVLVVVGLIVSVAGLSVSSGSRPYTVAGAVSGFSQLAEYALDEAQLGGFDLGLHIERKSEAGEDRYSYQWLARQDRDWTTVLRDELLIEPRTFPVGLELELVMEEQVVEFEPDEEEPGPQPQIIFYSSGETTPGILRWRDSESGELLWELEWDLIAQMELRQRGEVSDES
jgi:general secretion pathway protein H